MENGEWREEIPQGPKVTVATSSRGDEASTWKEVWLVTWASLLHHQFLGGREEVLSQQAGAEVSESTEGVGDTCDAMGHMKQDCTGGALWRDLKPQSGSKNPSKNTTHKSRCSYWTSPIVGAVILGFFFYNYSPYVLVTLSFGKKACFSIL
uniref:Uncharacterized protein n=1 Tax=Canis lupus familiaris TaxID=9615 RepID=A0A8C0RHA2_CANLF